MFDDLSSSENLGEEAQKPSEEERERSSFLSCWSPIIAGLVFSCLYYPLKNHPWSWFVAIASSYSVFVFVITFGSGFNDSSDFFGDPRAPKCVATLLLPHALLLALVMLAAYFWLRLIPTLPHWVTVEGRKGSWWEYFGIILACLVGVKEGYWMGAKIKLRLGTSED